jgi:hypothetical protein
MRAPVASMAVRPVSMADGSPLVQPRTIPVMAANIGKPCSALSASPASA